MSPQRSRAKDPVRVLLADDQPLFREALSRVIAGAPDLELVGAVADTAAAFVAATHLRPDVAVIDLRLPRLIADDLLPRLVQLEDGPRVLIVAESASDETILRILTAGATGYLPKSADEATIVDAIHRVACGDTSRGDHEPARVAPVERASAAGLSARELDIMVMLAQGATASQIGERLHLAASTVRGHIHDIYVKLGVKDRGAAVAAAIRLGLVS